MNIRVHEYRREDAVAYARRWALSRNPKFYNFDALGGDCTNFASQALYAGTGVMNYTPVMGWFYINPGKRAPAWSGVAFLSNFLTGNAALGPFGAECGVLDVEPGDIIQLSFDGEEYKHTLVVSQTWKKPAPDNILICAHSFDSIDRPLASYKYKSARFIKILGFRSK